MRQDDLVGGVSLTLKREDPFLFRPKEHRSQVQWRASDAPPPDTSPKGEKALELTPVEAGPDGGGNHGAPPEVETEASSRLSSRSSHADSPKPRKSLHGGVSMRHNTVPFQQVLRTRKQARARDHGMHPRAPRSPHACSASRRLEPRAPVAVPRSPSGGGTPPAVADDGPIVGQHHQLGACRRTRAV